METPIVVAVISAVASVVGAGVSVFVANRTRQIQIDVKRLEFVLKRREEAIQQTLPLAAAVESLVMESYAVDEMLKRLESSDISDERKRATAKSTLKGFSEAYQNLRSAWATACPHFAKQSVGRQAMFLHDGSSPANVILATLSFYVEGDRTSADMTQAVGAATLAFRETLIRFGSIVQRDIGELIAGIK